MITFINEKTKFIITEGRFSYLNVVFQRRAMAKFLKEISSMEFSATKVVAV